MKAITFRYIDNPTTADLMRVNGGPTLTQPEHEEDQTDDQELVETIKERRSEPSIRVNLNEL